MMLSGMLLLAAWSSNGWIESGHAMRMALHLGLHLALEKLADASAQQSRNEEEERHLSELLTFILISVGLISEQLFLLEYGSVCTGLIISCVLLFLANQRLTFHNRRLSLGTGRPIVLRDENTVRH